MLVIYNILIDYYIRNAYYLTVNCNFKFFSKLLNKKRLLKGLFLSIKQIRKKIQFLFVFYKLYSLSLYFYLDKKKI